ncbi:L-threonine synthase [Stella humosa]|uniref:Threonine synthase n=1 Tax=Stella humosa TaxID=94 RepID=A0A3N1KXM3_9PROT|nr:threonine synthase [Stella humosa]ROP84614.1 L-threonine synthase [Stella humosa]BBK34134.1 threonine synthase [Stella humosa]
MFLRCIDCAAALPAGMYYSCQACGGILEVVEPIRLPRPLPGAGMWSGDAALGVGDPAAVATLGEGMTPLHRAPGLARAIGADGDIRIKDETVNPTGSFKDRAVAAAVARARELGLPGIVCASSGNAGASAAAYAARAGLPAVIVVPTHTPVEKLTQIAAYGARLVQVDGHYSRAYAVGLDIARRHGLANVTTTYLNPYGVDALKTVGHEIFDQMEGRVPDWVLVPTGAGPLVRGVVQGFRERAPGHLPKLVAVQAEGCAPIVRAFEAGERAVRAWGTPTTFASGISDPLIGYERDGTHTLDLVIATGGLAVAVEDEAIRAAMALLARGEGILAEPTGASSVAALQMLLADGRIARDASVVCLVTGHGFKDLKVWREMPADIRRLEDPADADRLVETILAGGVASSDQDRPREAS